jgi:hypothetical protein
MKIGNGLKKRAWIDVAVAIEEVHFEQVVTAVGPDVKVWLKRCV